MSEDLKECSKCGDRKPLGSFRIRGDTGKPRSECRDCERKRDKTPSIILENVPKGPPSVSELARRMVNGAKSRAKTKGVPFDLEITDVIIPPICPVLRIPLVISEDGVMTDNSPTLDRMIPHLGYTKTNVKVISNIANRIKTSANSHQIERVLHYVKNIEEGHL